MDDNETPADDVVVRLDGVSRYFGSFAALDDVSLTVRRGEVLGIIGRSGAGKSTLIRLVNGLDRPDRGSVSLGGQSLAGLSERQLQPLRGRVGMVFQHFNLLANKTVEANVTLPLKIAGVPAAQRRARAAELLEAVGLTGKGKAYPAQLSGGQKQRVGIARALANHPVLLLSDEATSALDPETTLAILDLLRDINKRLGLTILLITHEMEVIRSIADRVVVLDHGKIVEQGPVAQVFSRPQAETTKSLLLTPRTDLPADLRAALGPSGTEAVVRVNLDTQASRRPLVADLALELGVSARLVHGGLDRVHGETVGTIFLAIPGTDPGVVTATLAFLEGRGALTEVLGYV